jgi:hypothetical protein
MRFGVPMLALPFLLICGCARGSSDLPSPKPDPNTIIDVTGSLGGVKPREARAQVEHLLGPGVVISTTTRHRKVGGTYTVTRVRYPASQLVVAYVNAGTRPSSVFSIFTASTRYHTAGGLRVGSTLSQARAEKGVRCSAQNFDFACQGGLGYERPVTGFTVEPGRVVRVFVVAVAD